MTYIYNMGYDELVKINSEFKLQIDDLKLQLQQKDDHLAQLIRLIYGTRSERFIPTTPNPDQLSLFDLNTSPQIADKPDSQTITYQRKNKDSKHKGRQLLDGCRHLPVEEQIIEVSHSDQAIKIGECITELLAYKPGKLYLKRIVRTKYKEPQTEQIICAEPLTQAIPKCEADHSLLAYITVSKFVDHLPEYRLQAIFKRESVIIPPSTMNNWTHQVSALMSPVADCIQKQILSGQYIQMDESTIRVMDGKKQSTHLGYMWVINSPSTSMVYFKYNKGRGRDAPLEILQTYSAILQTDGYNAYESIAKSNSDIIHAGCIAHARRKFEEALKGPHHDMAEHVLLLIQQLYAIERTCRENNYTEIQRLEARADSAKILQEIKTYIEGHAQILPPGSHMYKAVKYMLPRWETFIEYTKHGIIEIDNNLIENAIRPLALGRKNYLFAGSHDAAQNLANFYTIYGTCKKLNLNPYEYTLWLLDNIPHTTINNIHNLTPSSYKNYLESDKM